jgi:hypothetical protein
MTRFHQFVLGKTLLFFFLSEIYIYNYKYIIFTIQNTDCGLRFITARLS